LLIFTNKQKYLDLLKDIKDFPRDIPFNGRVIPNSIFEKQGFVA